MRARATCKRFSTQTKLALTKVEVLVVLAALAIVAALLLPQMKGPQPYAPRTSCANNLKQIGLSARTYALDNADHFPMQVSVINGGTMEFVGGGQVFPNFQVMSNELSTPKILVCPADKDRTYATNFAIGFSDQNLSYFLSVDAIPENGTTLLCGDRNLTNQRSAGSRFVGLSGGAQIGWTKAVHSKYGNVCFVDGRVEGVANGGRLTIVRIPDGITNRLAIP
jgi:prepilin-type processing-associated H-X9-DG protein